MKVKIRKIGSKITIDHNIQPKKLGIFILFSSAIDCTIKLGAFPIYVNAPKNTAALDIARRHQGAKILDEIKAISSELENLPPDDALANVNTNIAIFREKESEIKKKTVKLEEFSGAVDDSQWTEQAVITYEELLNQSTEEKSRVWLWVLAVFFFVVTVASGFVDQPVGIDLLCP